MNRLALIGLLLVGVVMGALAQAPQPRLTYEDRSGTTGHTLVVGGKTFGPYKDVYHVSRSTSATEALFLVTKRDRVYVVAQGREWGPLAADFEPDQTFMSDDGKVAAFIAMQYTDEEEGTTQTLLWVNGKSYGPYLGVYPFEYAEQGGTWIAALQTGEEEYDVLVNGKSQGPFASVDKVWVSPDGKLWGYVVRNTEGEITVVTQDKKYSNLSEANFDHMNPREPHWAFSLRLGDEEELIVVDGKEFKGYLNFSGLYMTYSGLHWGFQAEKLSDSGDVPVVVINGKEFVGEDLNTVSMGNKESFVWTVRDGSRVTSQVLSLP